MGFFDDVGGFFSGVGGLGSGVVDFVEGVVDFFVFLVGDWEVWIPVSLACMLLGAVAMGRWTGGAQGIGAFVGLIAGLVISYQAVGLWDEYT
jgi:hypothetical protein